ncbi:MAG: hypothetical protein BGO78_13375 [Chloroflexi bacterium 44-23]|nr:MAG: hypothetical protein BGO78_13375 [Chloroflexi bacterium 44-23]
MHIINTKVKFKDLSLLLNLSNNDGSSKQFSVLLPIFFEEIAAPPNTKTVSHNNITEQLQ